MELEIELATFQKTEWIEKDYEALSRVKAKALLFNHDQILLTEEQAQSMQPLVDVAHISEEIWNSSFKYYLGQINQTPLFAIEIPPSESAKMASLFSAAISLRIFLETSLEKLTAVIIRGKQLLNWHKASLYCSACGGKTKHSESETAKICLHCERVIYPSTSLAVLVLIEKGNQILLARSHYFRPGVYSVLAGFVEAGEPLEETLIREVQEEVGIQVKNIRYFGSQPWPFENSYMVAFRAEYHSGEIVPDLNEIEDAGWFTVDNLPLMPFKSSLSRKLIDHYVQERQLASVS